MLEIDGEEVEILRKYIPEWSDCSVSVTVLALATMILEQSYWQWMQFNGSSNTLATTIQTLKLLMLCKIPSFINGMNAELFTHLQDSYHSIMDALDPNDGIEFAAGLYNSSSFEQSLMNALADDGILVAQLG